MTPFSHVFKFYALAGWPPLPQIGLSIRHCKWINET